jgi:hypothetical protein
MYFLDFSKVGGLNLTFSLSTLHYRLPQSEKKLAIEKRET